MPYIAVQHDKLLHKLRFVCTYDEALTDVLTISAWMPLHDAEALLSGIEPYALSNIDASLLESAFSESKRGAPKTLQLIGKIQNLTRTVLYTERVNTK